MPPYAPRNLCDESSFKTRRRLVKAGLALGLAPGLAASAAKAQQLRPTINTPSPLLGRPAPEFDVETWVRGPAVTMSQLRGRVVAIDFFQLWCPMCNAFTGPLFVHWQNQRFKQAVADGRLALVGVHTVFEGFDYQSKERLVGYIDEKEKRYPVAHDLKRLDSFLPQTMKAWGNIATPTVALVDKQGLVRFHKAGMFDHRQVADLIDTLMAA